MCEAGSEFAQRDVEAWIGAVWAQGASQDQEGGPGPAGFEEAAHSLALHRVISRYRWGCSLHVLRRSCIIDHAFANSFLVQHWGMLQWIGYAPFFDGAPFTFQN